MELEQQNGDRDGGKNTDDSADDVVVDLLDSDDDEEVPASATGKQPQVGDTPLPAAPPAAPFEGVAVPPPAAGGGGDYSDESDIEIVGTIAAPAPPPQQQHRAGPAVASGTPASRRLSAMDEKCSCRGIGGGDPARVGRVHKSHADPKAAE